MDDRVGGWVKRERGRERMQASQAESEKCDV